MNFNTFIFTTDNSYFPPVHILIDLSQRRTWYNYWYTCMRTSQMNWYSCTFTRADVINYTRSLKAQSVSWDKIFLTTSSSKIRKLFLNDFLFNDRHHLTLVINVSIFPSHDRSRDDGGEDEEVLVLLWDVTAVELQRHSSFSHGELSAWRPRHEILDTSTRVTAFPYDQVSLEPSCKSERQSAFVLPCRRPDQSQTQINTQNCTLQNYRNSSPSNRSAARRRTRMEGKGRETQKKETKKGRCSPDVIGNLPSGGLQPQYEAAARNILRNTTTWQSWVNRCSWLRTNIIALDGCWDPWQQDSAYTVACGTCSLNFSEIRWDVTMSRQGTDSAKTKCEHGRFYQVSFEHKREHEVRYEWEESGQSLRQISWIRPSRETSAESGSCEVWQGQRWVRRNWSMHVVFSVVGNTDTHISRYQ